MEYNEQMDSNLEKKRLIDWDNVKTVFYIPTL